MTNWMTKQEVFDKAVGGLLTQGCQSLKGGNKNECMYRGDNGTKCAVGHLIDDDNYRPNVEGHNIYAKEVQVALLASRVDITDDEIFELLQSLQRIHDESSLDLWRERLEEIADYNNLTFGF